MTVVDGHVIRSTEPDANFAWNQLLSERNFTSFFQFEAQSKSRPSRQSSPPRGGGTSGVPSLTVGLLGPPPGGPMVVNGPPGLGGSHGHSHGHGPGPRLMMPSGGSGSGGPPPLTSLSLPPPPQHGSQRSLQPGIPVPPPSHPGHPAPHPSVLSGMTSLGHPHGHPHHPVGSLQHPNMTPPRGPPPGMVNLFISI